MSARTNEAYFSWLYHKANGDRYQGPVSFGKLLRRLHDTEFIFLIARDENRAEDGADLRWRYVCEWVAPSRQEVVLLSLDGPCSVLEMIVALAIRCEENIMDDPTKGDRTGQWFWGMLANMGLGGMTDDRYDELYIDMIVDRFLMRQYAADGKGGLFTVRDCDVDLRDVEIWHQLCYFLDTII